MPRSVVRFTIVDSALGRLLVGASDKGVTLALFAESDARLAELAAIEAPHAELVRDDEVLAEWGAALASAAGGATGEPVPLDLTGTAFQRLVWDALLAVPPGATVTYTELARSLGRPSATRAVAGACAANHVAVGVPCHRVVRADGGLGGYKWGVERKRALLAAERASAAG